MYSTFMSPSLLTMILPHVTVITVFIRVLLNTVIQFYSTLDLFSPQHLNGPKDPWN